MITKERLEAAWHFFAFGFLATVGWRVADALILKLLEALA